MITDHFMRNAESFEFGNSLGILVMDVVSQATPFSAYSAKLWEKGLVK